jgi:hypothetical protein
MLGGAVAATNAAEAQPFVPPSPVPQGSPIPRVLPSAPPSVAPGTVIPPPTAPSAEVPNRPVRVTSVDVEGVTAYPQPEIAQLAAGLVGPAVPLPQIDAARQAILQRYRADGYVLTTVSANLDNNGRLRFVVTEGASPASSSTATSVRQAPRCCASSTSSPSSSRSIRSRWSATCCWRRTCPASACAQCWSLPPTRPAR